MPKASHHGFNPLACMLKATRDGFYGLGDMPEAIRHGFKHLSDMPKAIRDGFWSSRRPLEGRTRPTTSSRTGRTIGRRPSGIRPRSRA